MRLLLAAVPLLLGAAPTDPLAGRVAGAPVQCVDLGRLQSPDLAGPRTILYRQNARRIWRTGPVGPCQTLRPLATLILDTQNGQVCRNDRFRIREPGALIPSAPCRFDAFVPYDRPSRGQGSFG